MQYVAADADEPLTVQSLLSASFSKEGLFVIGNGGSHYYTEFFHLYTCYICWK